MAPRDNQRARATARIAAHLVATGLAATSLRQLAGAAQASDRMLLYYFTDKADALASAMSAIAGDLGARLADAIPPAPRLAPAALVAAAAQITTASDIKPYMRLWIEVVAAAARGEAPFPTIAHGIADGFRSWIEARLDPAGLADPGGTAALILATVDGLALLDACSEDRVVARAVEAAGEAANPAVRR